MRKKSLQFWVLLPPLEGQKPFKAIQRSLMQENDLSLATPPFLYLGESKGVLLEQFHRLGKWLVELDLKLCLGYRGLKSSIEGFDSFAKSFTCLPDYYFPPSFLILSWLKDSAIQLNLKKENLTFYTYFLVEWRLVLYCNTSGIQGVEIEYLQEIKKRRVQKIK